jgi:hypothetical protein
LPCRTSSGDFSGTYANGACRVPDSMRRRKGRRLPGRWSTWQPRGRRAFFCPGPDMFAAGAVQHLSCTLRYGDPWPCQSDQRILLLRRNPSAPAYWVHAAATIREQSEGIPNPSREYNIPKGTLVDSRERPVLGRDEHAGDGPRASASSRWLLRVAITAMVLSLFDPIPS